MDDFLYVFHIADGMFLVYQLLGEFWPIVTVYIEYIESIHKGMTSFKLLASQAQNINQYNKLRTKVVPTFTLTNSDSITKWFQSMHN